MDTNEIFMDEEQEKGIFAEFHQKSDLIEGDKELKPLSGILRLILVKYISSCIIDTNQINSNEVKKIIKILKKGIREKDGSEKDIVMNLKENSGCNILTYINYLCTVMTDSKINDLLNLFEEDKKNEIMGFWNILSVYEEINQLFEIEIFNAIKNDYFEYSLISLSISQNNNRKRFLETMQNCPNLENKFLFHGTSIEKISKIIISFFRYPNRPMFGKGKNFTDMLDYASFYGNDLGRHNFGSTIPVNQTFSCVSAEVYYDKNKKIP